MTADRRVATLHVWRGDNPKAGRFDVFEVPFQEGASVLDGLIWIRTRRDPSLAIRYSCMNANVCKECVISVNGKTTYACTARLRDGVLKLEPAPGKTLVRDLVTDLVGPKEKLDEPA
jgi:succinate dehydrogenase/fumarate reductase-like Fe-S protein